MVESMRSMRSLIALVGALAAVALMAGCSGTPSGNGDSGNPNDSGQTPDSGRTPDAGQTPDSGQQDAGTPPPTSLTLTTLANAGFSAPMATAISSNGGTVYFTAFDANNNAGVFKVTGVAAPTTVASGAPLAMPSGLALSADDGTLFIADVGSTGLGNGTDFGGVYSVAASGGTPAAIAVTGIQQPTAVSIAGDGSSLLIAAKDATGKPGIFKVAAAGGAATALAQTGLVDPGEAVEAGGAQWVTEHRAASGYGGLWRFVGGTGTDMTSGAIRYGFPAGVCASTDGTTVYSATQGGILYTPSSGVGAGGSVTLTPANTTFANPSGLSRARSSNTFALTDGEGANGKVISAQ
jgi:hypothetical protein